MTMRIDFRQHALSSALFAAFALGGATFAANAAVTTTTFTVSANVEAACTLSATGLAFGIVSTIGPAVDGQSTLATTCTNGTAFTIGLSAGVSAGAAVTTRHMTHTDTTTLLDYNLSPASSGGINWDLIGGTTTVPGTGTGIEQVIDVYGQIPGNQNVIAGIYSDTITATIDF
jgi:spore coat protein U domain-containing protein, fimbrial subunit CupE1/2/3/6